MTDAKTDTRWYLHTPEVYAKTVKTKRERYGDPCPHLHNREVALKAWKTRYERYPTHKRAEVICAFCSKKHRKDGEKIKRNKNNFCSHTCWVAFRKANPVHWKGTPELHEKKSKTAHQMYQERPEMIEKIRNSTIQWYANNCVPRERYEKAHITRLRWWATHPEAIEKKREDRKKQIFPKIDSSIERAVKAKLDELEVPYVAQYHIIGSSLVDIAFPEHKLAVYVDGDYWHSQPKQIERDLRSNAKLSSIGWNVLRLPEHQIHADMSRCIEEIIDRL